jgi:hypothetical protein
VCNCLLFIILTSFFVTELSGTGRVLLAAAIWSISGQLGVAKLRSLYISWWRPIQCSMFLALSRTKSACIIIMTSRKTLGKYVQQPTFLCFAGISRSIFGDHLLQSSQQKVHTTCGGLTGNETFTPLLLTSGNQGFAEVSIVEVLFLSTLSKVVFFFNLIKFITK